MRAIVPFILLVIPLIEIALFVVVGDVIGLWPTLAATLLAAVVGVVLIRGRGRAAFERLRPGQGPAAVPIGSVIDGAAVVIAGMLLLIPGFLTDLLGVSLLLPPVRRRLGRVIGQRFRMAAGPSPFGDPGFGQSGFGQSGFGQAGFDPGGFPSAAGPVIEGEAVVVRDPPAPPAAAADDPSHPPRVAPPRPRDPPP
ncbi:UPF0716 protein FxsA [Stella humosa]|uniref:UPF0716 protein FxsA n=1 Tax=Stella humosa TaxID=94 RepID=A0A3N1LHG4_9PROT|nr:FxsA family protein [Stella humosa]ROP90967.1 UPF0716 protein FxsA [Stella humosa]